MSDYLKVVYSEKERPYTAYPPKLCKHLFDRFSLKPGERLLDLGCGRGEFLKGFAGLGMTAEGLDQCSTAKDLNKGYKVEIADFDKEALPYEDNSFDAIFCKSVIEHFYYPDKIFKEAYRILKPGGKFIVMTPDWEAVYKTSFYEDYTHRTPFTVTSLKDIYAIFNFTDIFVCKFRQLPLLWKYPFLNIFAKIIAVVCPRSKIKAIRFSKEIMLLGCAKKPI